MKQTTIAAGPDTKLIPAVKTYPILRPVCFVAFAVALLALALRSAPAQTPPLALQVTVDVPATWRPFLADDIAQAFFSRIDDTFRRKGYLGGMTLVDRLDQAQANLPRLDITLIEWRIDRIGNVQCTFGAQLVNGKDAHNLGLFSGTALRWRTRADNRWELDQAMDDSAHSAIRDLYAKLAKQGLLPKTLKSTG